MSSAFGDLFFQLELRVTDDQSTFQAEKRWKVLRRYRNHEVRPNGRDGAHAIQPSGFVSDKTNGNVLWQSIKSTFEPSAELTIDDTRYRIRNFYGEPPWNYWDSVGDPFRFVSVNVSNIIRGSVMKGDKAIPTKIYGTVE